MTGLIDNRTTIQRRRSPTALCIAVVLIAALDGRHVSADTPNSVGARLAAANGWIYGDLGAGMAEAKQTGRPLMVVLRCPP